MSDTQTKAEQKAEPKTFTPTKVEKSAFEGILIRNNLLMAESNEVVVEAAARLGVSPKGLSYNFQTGVFTYQDPSVESPTDKPNG